MEFKDFIVLSMTEVRSSTLRVVEDLSQEQITWTPAARCNPIGFIFWHISRIEDLFFNVLIARRKEVWETDGWHQRFGLPATGTGMGWDEDEGASFNCPPRADLLAYAQRVRESALEVLEQLDMDGLDDAPRPGGPESLTSIGQILRVAARHDNHHQGAMSYLVGLMQQTGRG